MWFRTASPNPKHEIQTILRADDVQLVNTAMSGPDANAKAIKEIREYIDTCRRANKQIILHELVEKRFGERPYGWPELEVVLGIARLAVLKEIDLLVDKVPLKLGQAYEHITTPKKQRKVIIVQRQIASDKILKNAQKLGKDLFGKQGPSEEDPLYRFLKDHLQRWNADLNQYKGLAQTGNYPGLEEINSGLADLRKFVEEDDSVRFLECFVGNTSELEDLGENYTDLRDFYSNQKHSWEKLGEAVRTLGQNRLQLEQHPEAGPALRRMEEILKVKAPYAMLHEAAALMSTAMAVNAQIVEAARAPACVEIQGLIDGVKDELGKASASAALESGALAGLQKLLAAANSAQSIAHIAQARQAAEAAYDAALTRIEEALAPKPDAAGTSDTLDNSDTSGRSDATGPTSAASVKTPPPPKKRRAIEVKTLCSKSFLEDQADVEAFLTTLRARLEAAIEAGERVQIK